jgi:hypothetical protein
MGKHLATHINTKHIKYIYLEELYDFLMMLFKKVTQGRPTSSKILDKPPVSITPKY